MWTAIADPVGFSPGVWGCVDYSPDAGVIGKCTSGSIAGVNMDCAIGPDVGIRLHISRVDCGTLGPLRSPGDGETGHSGFISHKGSCESGGHVQPGDCDKSRSATGVGAVSADFQPRLGTSSGQDPIPSWGAFAHNTQGAATFAGPENAHGPKSAAARWSVVGVQQWDGWGRDTADRRRVLTSKPKGGRRACSG